MEIIGIIINVMGYISSVFVCEWVLGDPFNGFGHNYGEFLESLMSDEELEKELEKGIVSKKAFFRAIINIFISIALTNFLLYLPFSVLKEIYDIFFGGDNDIDV